MLDEQFEFLLTQYLDGALPQAQAKEVELRLAQDPHARNLLEEYRKLDQVLKAAPPIPETNWDAMRQGINSAIDAQGPSIYGKPNRFRIGLLPAIASALVASLLVAVGVIDHVIYRQTQADNPIASAIHHPQPTEIAQAPAAVIQSQTQVIGPQIEAAGGPAVASVTLGPAPQTASAFEAYPDAEAVVVVRPRVTIAAANVVADDSPLSQ